MLSFGEIAMRPGEIAYLVGDPAAFSAATGWSPVHDVASGVAQAVAELTGAGEARQ